MLGKPYDTVIISDLHLGSGVSRAADALEFLQSMQFSSCKKKKISPPLTLTF